jgi:hypothetical protein
VLCVQNKQDFECASEFRMGLVGTFVQPIEHVKEILNIG